MSRTRRGATKQSARRWLGVTLLVPVVGALYVGVGASSFLQRVRYKWTRRRGTPRRLFRMAPIRHHFDLAGRSESTIAARFWIVNAVAPGAGAALFYSEAPRLLRLAGRAPERY